METARFGRWFIDPFLRLRFEWGVSMTLPSALFRHGVRLLSLAAIPVFLLASVVFGQSAVEQEDRIHLFDHEAYMANSLEVGPQELNSGLMGDFVNLDKGELSFSVTDISIPGNFPLPVELTRIINSDKYRPKFTSTRPTSVNAARAEWGLDLSYITLPTITPSGTVGCVESESDQDNYKKKHVHFLKEYYEVPLFHAPGVSGLLLRANKKTVNTKVFGKNPPEFTNSEMWRISQTKKNGKCTWKAKDTNGNTYSFDQAVVLSNFNGIRRHAVVVTQVTDVHGNWVKYSYDNKRGNRLSRIYSSDGREISLHYNSGGRLSRAVANGRTWTYSYDSEKWWGYDLLYLKKVTRPDGQYWEYDALKGVSAHIKNRCVFGSGAYVRHPSGVKAYFKTKKIVNFAEATPPYGYVKGSQRAACLPSKLDYERDFYEKPIRIQPSGEDQAKLEPLDDGKSKFGIFLTFFSSAVVEKKLVNTDETEIIFGYEYKEGDLFNPDMTKNSYPTVHKDPDNEVAVNTKFGKVRIVTDPYGTKHEYTYGRNLNNTGDLLSEKIYEKGSTTPISKTTYEYILSENPLGYPWYQSNVNTKKERHWTRTAKMVLALGGEKYTTEQEFDDRGYKIKTTKSSTLQKETAVISAKLIHKTDIWVLGLPTSISVNGKEFVGVEYDGNGQVILESKLGNPLRRYKHNDDGTLAASRNGKNETTKFESYKRGTPQKITLPNGAVHKFTVDDNGWMTRAITPSGFVVNVSHNRVGWVTKIDRPLGYADTTISYKRNSSGLVQSLKTDNKIVVTTFDGFHQPIKTEARDVTGQIASTYVLNEYDKLQRPIFESVPSSSPEEIAGVRTSYDVLNRVVEKKETVSPFSITKIEYLSDNRVRTTDPRGNKTVSHRSGFSSPEDGYETLIERADGTKIYFDHDKWHNVTSVRQVGGGRTLTNSYEYDSRFRLCLQVTPEAGREFFGYNAINQLVKSQKNAPATLKCETPSSSTIDLFTSDLSNNSLTTTTTTATTPTTRTPTSSNTPNGTNTTTSSNTTNTSSQKPTGGNAFKPGQCHNCSPTLWRAHSETIDKMTYYAYDTNGLLVSINYPSGTEDIQHFYDISSNLVKTVRGNSVILYTYGLQNELKSETLSVDGKTYTVEYGYNTSGGLISYKSPNKRQVRYTLNAFNQIVSIRIGNHTYVSNATYHPSGQLSSALYDNGYTLANTLNQRTFIDGAKLTKTSEALFDISILYGKGHQVTAINDNLDTSNNQAFTYDALNRLTTADGPWGKGAYSFDKFNNLLTKSIGNRKVTLQYDQTKNHLIKSIDTGHSGTRNISHDERGNVSTLGGLFLTHDHAERLTTVSGLSSSSYSYDGNLHRVKTIEGGQTAHWFHSQSGELIYTINTTTEQYTEYVNFENASSLRLNEAGEGKWVYAPSFVGYSVALNESGSIYWQESVTPFGELSTKSSLNDNQPSYHGHVRDEETGLFYMKARFYDPTIGQFISPDPVSFMTGGIKHLNRYVYVSNDPLNYYDPDGLAEILLQIKAYHVKFGRGHLYIEYPNPNNPDETYIFRGGFEEGKFMLNANIEAQNTLENASRDDPSKLVENDKAPFVVTEVTVDIGDAPDGFSKFLDDANLLASDINQSETPYEVLTNNSNTVANEFIIAVTGEEMEISEEEKGGLTYPGRKSNKLRVVTNKRDRFTEFSASEYNSFPNPY